jgi:hypothetical protein
MPSLQELLEGLPKEYHYAVKENLRLEICGLFDMDTSADEDKDYRQWAREEYTPEQMIDPTWHPIIVDECIKIIKEFIAD